MARSFSADIFSRTLPLGATRRDFSNRIFAVSKSPALRASLASRAKTIDLSDGDIRWNVSRFRVLDLEKRVMILLNTERLSMGSTLCLASCQSRKGIGGPKSPGLAP